VLIVPGTYETSVGADPAAPACLQSAVGDGRRSRFAVGRVQLYYVPYPAQFGNPMPYEQSRAAGVTATTTQLAATAARCPATSFALTGFSQGASVAGDGAGRGGGAVFHSGSKGPGTHFVSSVGVAVRGLARGRRRFVT